jgi:hypothetical protein
LVFLIHTELRYTVNHTSDLIVLVFTTLRRTILTLVANRTSVVKSIYTD